MQDKKNIPPNLPPNFFQKYKDLPPLWQNPELVSALIDLTNGHQVYQSRTKTLIRELAAFNFEQTFYLLLAIDGDVGNQMFISILQELLEFLLKDNMPNSEILEAFFISNREFLIYLLAKVCRDGNFIHLSKLLDCAQQIKDFFIPLTQTEYHSFSIQLSILAVKREFLRLENWIEGRLLNGSLAWIEALTGYITVNLLKPLELYGEPQRELTEQILERAQLNLNTVAVIFENFLLSERFSGHIPADVREGLKVLYQHLQYFLPELTQICTNDTEKKANKLLEDLYVGNSTLEEFITVVQQLKNSQSNQDQEVLSCIIINLIDEFRFYHQFPEKELYITSDIFGSFIAKRVIDGKVLVVFLKALTDSLEKDEKMFQFSLRALQHFALDLTLEISEDFYKVIFSNQKLRSEQFMFLSSLHQALQRHKKLNQIIPKELTEEIQQRRKAADKLKEEAKKTELITQGQEKQSIKNKLLMKGNKFQEKSLLEFLKNKFKNFDKQLGLDKQSQEKITFYLNAVEEKRLDIGDFQKLLDSGRKINWFAVYLVYDRIPHEYANQSTYQKLIIKSEFKDLYYEVYQKSMAMINQLVDYLLAKDQVTPQEFTVSRNCGKWVSLITLYSNRPILLKDFDIKGKIYRAVEEQKLGNIIPAICTILLLVEKSSFFKIHVPYINSLIDVLREILYLPSVPGQTRAYIDVLFNQLKIKPSALYPFNYLDQRLKKTTPEREKSFFILKSLPESVRVDLQGATSYEVQEYRQLVAMAIDQSIKDIIQPVLERSVTNTLETTRELVLKDFIVENEEDKLNQGCESMITNLTWNLALVTCRDPLKTQIQQNLYNQFSIQTNLSEQLKRHFSEQLASLNLKIACDIIKKIVIENALAEVKKDTLILKEIEARREQKGPSERAQWLKRELPAELYPSEKDGRLKTVEIYARVSESKNSGDDDGSYFFTWSQPVQEGPRRGLEKKKIAELISQLDNEILNKNEREKMAKLNEIYLKLSQTLQQARPNEQELGSLAEEVLSQLFLQPIMGISIEKLKCYSDVLIIYSNVHSSLPTNITAWLFKIGNQLFKHQLLSVYLRRNLLHLKDFDRLYSQLLQKDSSQPLICIVQVLRSLVIEDKIFSIYSFPLVLEQLLRIGKQQQSLPSEIQIFLKNLIAFVEHKNKMHSLSFKLTNLEPEYQKLFQDVEEYFKDLDKNLFSFACEQLNFWKSAFKEEEYNQAVQTFLEKLGDQNEKTLLVFFCYIFEISTNEAVEKRQGLQQNVLLDYSLCDAVSLFAYHLLKNSQDSAFFFEKLLTALIIVLTKKHFFESKTFSQKPFYRILSNILNSISKQEQILHQHREKFSLVLVQTLHILQPIKYPGFAFAWLQLLPSPFLVKSLLGEGSIEGHSNYTILLLDLMTFFKDVQTIQALQLEEAKSFYKGSLRILLVLIHDYQDFLSDQSFLLLEEIPPSFKQFRNIVLSSFPKNLKITNPFEQQEQENLDDLKNLPMICQKVDARINAHNLHSALINYIKNVDPHQQDQEAIQGVLDKFYVTGYQNQVKINVPLLESFVVYVPYCLYSNIFPNAPPTTFKQYLDQSYSLFLNLLLSKDYKFREKLIQAILNNLRYPNPITHYFCNLIILVFTTVNKKQLQEQIFANLLDRLIVEKPHPWGVLMLIHWILTVQGFDNTKLLKENKALIHPLVKVAFKYARINVNN